MEKTMDQDTDDEVKSAAPIPDMSDDELQVLARDWAIGHAYFPPDAESARLSFLILALADPRQLPDNVGWVYEYIDKANTLAVNGLPTFFSCRFVSTNDWPKLIDKAGELHRQIYPELYKEKDDSKPAQPAGQ